MRSGLTVVVGGVGELYQGDLDAGRVAIERLADERLSDAVVVEDFSYGAVAALQRVQELDPDALLLIAAVERGRAPGSVERRDVEAVVLDTARARDAVADAVTGYVTLDLLLEVGAALDALPPEVVAIEIEPAVRGPSEQLSAAGEEAVDEAIGLARAELARLGVV